MEGSALNGCEKLILCGVDEVPAQRDAAQFGIDEHGAVSVCLLYTSNGSKHEFLFHPAPYALPLFAAHQREHHGDAHAPAFGLESALPHVLAFGKSALPRVQLSRPSGQHGAAFRYSQRAQPARHCGRVGCGATGAARRARFFVARCVGRAGRLDRGRRLLGDAAAQHFCRGDACGQAACCSDGRYPPRRSADAGAGAEPALVRLLQVCAPVNARGLADRRGHHQRRGRLPGFCPHHDRLVAPCADSGSLRFRLSLPEPRGPRPVSYTHLDFLSSMWGRISTKSPSLIQRPRTSW